MKRTKLAVCFFIKEKPKYDRFKKNIRWVVFYKEFIFLNPVLHAQVQMYFY